MEEDIIVAIATSRLEAAISVVRLSGEGVIDFVQSFFTGKIAKAASHTINYGFLMDNEIRVDEVLVSIYRGTRTFTGEEMVEISCHGGVFITNKVLELCLKKGARMATRGEFTKRAFLNGRIDLAQSEAVLDMITAKNEYASQLALKGIQGSVSNFLNDLEEELIAIITNIEVNIDYPEYLDIEQLTTEVLLEKSVSLHQKMERIIEDSKNVKLIKDGISTVIIGKPNVGKSSLLNALLKEDKAIVTDIAGTTRDLVEGSISVDGIMLNMIDTAGIRETDNMIEAIGVSKSRELINQADLVLLVIDGSRELEKEDRELLELTENTNRILIINKQDIGQVVDLEGIQISAKNQDIHNLTEKIKELFNLGMIAKNSENLLTNVRQSQLLYQASQALNTAIEAMNNLIPPDLVVEDLYEAWSYIKEILGQEAKEDLLDELFKRFCIGK